MWHFKPMIIRLYNTRLTSQKQKFNIDFNLNTDKMASVNYTIAMIKSLDICRCVQCYFTSLSHLKLCKNKFARE